MEQLKHSGIGIASFVISIISGFVLFVLFGIAGFMEVSTPGGIDEESAGAIIVGLFLIFFWGIAVVALGLGIAGLIQKRRKKIFAILGTVFAAATLLITLLAMALGLAMDG